MDNSKERSKLYEEFKKELLVIEDAYWKCPMSLYPGMPGEQYDEYIKWANNYIKKHG
jgi:hypothetical protein